jgi:hypothetical protein
MGTKDKASNKALNMKGKAKETIGKITGRQPPRREPPQPCTHVLRVVGAGSYSCLTLDSCRPMPPAHEPNIDGRSREFCR